MATEEARHVARDIVETGELLDLRLQLVGRLIQLVLVGRLQRELVEALRYLPADPDGRRILQIHSHPGEVRELRPQVVDDLADQLFPLGARFQPDQQLPEVRAAQRRGLCAADVVSETPITQ